MSYCTLLRPRHGGFQPRQLAKACWRFVSVSSFHVTMAMNEICICTSWPHAAKAKYWYTCSYARCHHFRLGFFDFALLLIFGSLVGLALKDDLHSPHITAVLIFKYWNWASRACGFCVFLFLSLVLHNSLQVTPDHARALSSVKPIPHILLLVVCRNGVCLLVVGRQSLAQSLGIVVASLD